MSALYEQVTYPGLTAPAPSVTGATLNSTVAEVSTFTADSPPVATATERDIRPLFLRGSAGILRFSVVVTPLAGASIEAQPQVLFDDDNGDQVGRFSGASRTTTDPVVLSMRVPVPRLASVAYLRVLSTLDTSAGQWTEQVVRLWQEPMPEPFVAPDRDPDFGTASPNGVAPSEPSVGLPDGEASSAARRSPQVRYAQLIDSVRPDLIEKRNAREV